jgi:hypothetical protein
VRCLPDAVTRKPASGLHRVHRVHRVHVRSVRRVDFRGRSESESASTTVHHVAEAASSVRMSYQATSPFGNASVVPRNFSPGGQQIQLRTEGRENRDLGGGIPLVRDSTQFANE